MKASKALSWLLRHGAEKEGLVIHSGGWIKLDDILRKPNFKKVNILIISIYFYIIIIIIIIFEIGRKK